MDSYNKLTLIARFPNPEMKQTFEAFYHRSIPQWPKARPESEPLLCTDCSRIFQGEFVYHLDEDYPKELEHIFHNPPYRLYSSDKATIASLLKRKCHLCFLQGRRLQQVGAKSSESFWIRYLIECGEDEGDGLLLSFSYSQTSPASGTFKRRSDTHSQVFHLSLLDSRSHRD